MIDALFEESNPSCEKEGFREINFLVKIEFCCSIGVCLPFNKGNDLKKEKLKPKEISKKKKQKIHRDLYKSLHQRPFNTNQIKRVSCCTVSYNFPTMLPKNYKIFFSSKQCRFYCMVCHEIAIINICF